jgi:hypothetical protein
MHGCFQPLQLSAWGLLGNLPRHFFAPSVPWILTLLSVRTAFAGTQNFSVRPEHLQILSLSQCMKRPDFFSLSPLCSWLRVDPVPRRHFQLDPLQARVARNVGDYFFKHFTTTNTPHGRSGSGKNFKLSSGVTIFEIVRTDNPGSHISATRFSTGNDAKKSIERKPSPPPEQIENSGWPKEV